MIFESDIAAGRSILKEHLLLGLRCGSIASDCIGGIEGTGISRVGHIADIKGAIACIGALVAVGEGEHQVGDIVCKLRQDGIERCGAARLEEEAVARDSIVLRRREERLRISVAIIAAVEELPAEGQFVIGVS